MNTVDVPARPGWRTRESATGPRTGQSPGRPSAAFGERPVLPALLASFVMHLLLALLLSLVVFGTAGDSDLSEFVLARSETLALEETPTFELQPHAEPEWLETPVDQTVRLPELTLEPPPKPIALPAAPLAEEAGAEPSTERPSAALTGAEDKVASSIQERVAEAGGRRGEVQFALAWTNVNDVDLHVITPSGERISHLNKRSATGGTLDVDMNVRGESTEPVENVRWLSDAPWGRYTVLIHLFRVHRPQAGNRVYRGSPFQLLAQLGSRSEIRTDTVSAAGSQVSVFRFQYIPERLPEAQRAALTEELEQLQLREEALAAPLLEEASAATNPNLRDRQLNNLIRRYPHTDAAIQAMRMLGGDIRKT